VIPLPSFQKTSRIPAGIALIALIAGAALMAAPVSAYGYADNYEGFLGETIELHGVAYNSDEIYLFMTGPGLPDDGVMLTDTSRLASQGQFNMVDVARDGTWSMKWDTSRIENQIDYGTYTVYAVNAPADASNLDGHSYQAMTVYLKDGGLSKNRVSVGTHYTMNLADDDTTATTRITITVTTPPPTSPPATTEPATAVTSALATATPTKKSAALPFIALVGLVAAGCIVALRRV
jgi:hypothetical protein